MNARAISSWAGIRWFCATNVLLAVLLCGGLTSGCAKGRDPAASEPKKILRLSQRNEPSDLDPATATLPDEFFIIRALCEGLVAPAPVTMAEATPEAVVLPAAAERWEKTDDGLTYTFHLRPTATWSNGEPVTADDFLNSYRRILTPSTGAPKAALFFMVKNAQAFAAGKLTDFSAVGFQVVDRLTFRITLERPMPEFLLYVASGPWLPINERVIAAHGRAWTRPENYVGNGPFVLTEWRPNQRIITTRNPRYHRPSAVKLDEIHFMGIDSADTEERAFRAEQLDVTMTVPFAKIGGYVRDRPGEIHRAPLAETRFLSFNTQREPLRDRRVRTALSMAIDRELITRQLLHGGHLPADRLVPPPLRGKVDDASGPTPSLDLDSDRARTLLAEAGFPGGRGFPRLELTTWVNSPITEVIQQMWKRELGIEVGLAIREAKVHVSALREGNYDIAFITAIPDVADAANLLEEFISNAPGNYPHWSDRRFDELMELAKNETDRTKRNAALLAAEDRLMEQSPLAPLYFNSKNWLMSSRVRGWQHDSLWTRFYLDLEVIDPE